MYPSCSSASFIESSLIFSLYAAIKSLSYSSTLQRKNTEFGRKIEITEILQSAIGMCKKNFVLINYGNFTETTRFYIQIIDFHYIQSVNQYYRNFTSPFYNHFTESYVF